MLASQRGQGTRKRGLHLINRVQWKKLKALGLHTTAQYDVTQFVYLQPDFTMGIAEQGEKLVIEY